MLAGKGMFFSCSNRGFALLVGCSMKRSIILTSCKSIVVGNSAEV